MENIKLSAALSKVKMWYELNEFCRLPTFSTARVACLSCQ